jgi:general secretion pathway protein G
VILGVLAGIVVFAVSAFNKDGQLSACKADKKNVEIALEAYYAKNSSRPASGNYAPLTAPAAQYLKEAPSTAHYSFSWDANGVVSVGAGTDGPPAGC